MPPDVFSNVFALLTWRTRLVPLIGQDEQLHGLVRWASATTGPKIRLLTGEGGSGKSRIAAELAQTLNDHYTMTAGFLKLDRGVAIPKRPTLFILDYPEERRDFTRTLLKDIAAHPEWPVRLLLLSRRTLNEWDDDIDAANVRHLVNQQHFAITTLDDTDAERLFGTAVEELVRRYPVVAPRLAPDAFQKWLVRNPNVHRRPLFSIAAAIHAVTDPANALEFSLRQVVDALVKLERGRLQRVSKDAGFREDAAPRLAALAALRGGFGAAELERFAEPALRIGLPEPAYILDDIRRIPWWSGNRWPAPQPDILAAALFYAEFSRAQQRAPDWLWTAIVGNESNVADRLARLAYDIRTIYDDEGAMFVQWLVNMIDGHQERATALYVLASADYLPLILAPMAVRTHEELLKTAGTDKDRARFLSGLSRRLSESGDRDRALRNIQEAVEIYRRLAAEPEQSAAFEPALALSLNNLSVMLNDTGDRDGALSASQEAVDIYRRLTQVRSAVVHKLLLNIRPSVLSDSGDPEGVLRALREAQIVYGPLIKALIQEQLAAVHPALARVFNELFLDESGDREGRLRAVLRAAKKFADFYGLWAKVQPAAFDYPPLRFLNRFLKLFESGDREGALRALSEGVKMALQLAQVESGFELGLAMSLTTLSVMLKATGDREGALRAIQEAVDIYRGLAQVRSAAFEPDLALSLNNLSAMLNATGDRKGALRSVQEAVEIYRGLAQVRLAAFEPRLALSLNTLSVMLSNTGDRDGALRSVQEAVEIYRRLAKAQPAALEPRIALSLNTLSDMLSNTGDREGALRAVQEAVEIYRRLAQAQPAAFEPDLASSLNNLSGRLGDSGDRAGALRAIEAAVEIYRRLAQAQPAAFEPDLASSLNNLSGRLGDSGDRAGALCAIEAAVDIYGRLAQAQPAAFEPALASSLRLRDALIAS
jgi:tetratricopeptide (TPR) repeat protein